MHVPLLDLYHSFCCKVSLKDAHLDHTGVHSAVFYCIAIFFSINIKVAAGRIKAYTDSLMLAKGKLKLHRAKPSCKNDIRPVVSCKQVSFGIVQVGMGQNYAKVCANNLIVKSKTNYYSYHKWIMPGRTSALQFSFCKENSLVHKGENASCH